MIELRDIHGRRRYVAADAVASITETGPSSQWHGIKCIVTLFDGSAIECGDECAKVAEMVRNERAAA